MLSVVSGRMDCFDVAPRINKLMWIRDSRVSRGSTRCRVLEQV